MFELTYNKAINANKLASEIKESSVANKYIYITTNGSEIKIGFNEELTQLETDEISNVVNNHICEFTQENIKKSLARAIDFGNGLLIDFATENILLGITQAGKTAAVSSCLHHLGHFIATGSLYQAMAEVDSLISAGLDPNLAPFITEERLLSYKTRIQAYLGI